MEAGRIGVVVIGRNEGERLRICLSSLQDAFVRVYVDSGSSDGSQALASKMGFEVLSLDPEIGFTAARARNAGFQRIAKMGEVHFVQFIDGDCEVRPQWLEQATADITKDPGIACVFGRRRERNPERNLFHRACDIEWQVPVGEVSSCGGDAMFRVAALREVNGFDSNLIAGEEPDLCLRLRQRGWTILSNGREMTLHDVAIDSLSQWWQRARRAGFGIAQLVESHGLSAERSWVRLLRSAQAFSAVVALALLIGMIGVFRQHAASLLLALFLLALATIQVLRTALLSRSKFPNFSAALKWSLLIFISKFAQLQGYLSYKLKRRGGGVRIIEYK